MTGLAHSQSYRSSRSVPSRSAKTITLRVSCFNGGLPQPLFNVWHRRHRALPRRQLSPARVNHVLPPSLQDDGRKRIHPRLFLVPVEIQVVTRSVSVILLNLILSGPLIHHLEALQERLRNLNAIRLGQSSQKRYKPIFRSQQQPIREHVLVLVLVEPQVNLADTPV